MNRTRRNETRSHRFAIRTLGMLAAPALTWAAVTPGSVAEAAETVYSNLGPGHSHGDDARIIGRGDDGESIEQANAFIPVGGSFTLNRVAASIEHRLGPDQLKLSIYDSHHGQPFRRLETAEREPFVRLEAPDELSPRPAVFTFTGTTVLREGVEYWIVASAANAGRAVWYMNDQGAKGRRATRVGGGHAWLMFEGSSLGAFRVEATRVPAPTCRADFDGSGSVDALDLAALLVTWGACRGFCPTDIDRSGAVDAEDLLALLPAWGSCP